MTYYPRPLLKRNSFFSLCGTWQLNGKDIEIPFPPEAPLSNYKDLVSGKLEYKKSFSLPDNYFKKNEKVILNFGAVDQICDVYLNDSFLIHHEGGYLPFSIDITDKLNSVNTLKVTAIDELDYFYPFGKQSRKPSGMWYTPVSGIWQPVWIEAYDKDGIDDLTIRTDTHSLSLSITSNSDEFTVEFKGFKETFNTRDIRIEINDPYLWSCEDPYLYDLKISTKNDQIESYFALREIEIKEINNHKRIFLNNEPFFINGLLDQGYFEEGIFLPEKPEDYEEDVRNIKELGFNCLRKHIKVEPEAFYYYCDKLGIVVIQDMVNSGAYRFFRDTILATAGLTHLRCPISDQKRYDFFLEHSKETIRHLKSHPCIIGYTIYNEGWGQQDASGTYEILKQLDPDRLFDSNSGWFFDDKSDFDSYHIYFRNKVLKGKDKLLLLSECGGFIRDIADHKSEKGTTWGYGKTDSEDELTDKIITMHNEMVIPSIHNGMVGCIMTQISDVEGEINGVYTYDRKICKVNKEKILEANQKLQKIYSEDCK
ncbi:MAG: glycoside hydrolase family 2 [Erysipelotrichaceae bacterium]|nr:glycoside hydrolase family 2 [Erysipelotrichaceae bacterium]